MSIRIRQVDGRTIALCAAKCEAKEGDIYLDDAAHVALATKFSLGWHANGLMPNHLSCDEDIAAIEKEMGGKIPDVL